MPMINVQRIASNESLGINAQCIDIVVTSLSVSIVIMWAEGIAARMELKLKQLA